MARSNRAARATRQQATRLAVLAFVAADCAGIWYAQQRLSQPDPAAARFAYETPGAVEAGRMAAPAFAQAGQPAPAASVVPVAAPAPALALSPVAPASHRATATVAARAAAPAIAAAPRLTPAPVAPHRADMAPTPAGAPFDHAFALDGEAPEAEQRFGQSAPEAGGLADLLVPRDEPAPIFDRAGIAPVTGQAASMDAPVEAPAPAEAPAADLPAIKG